MPGENYVVNYDINVLSEDAVQAIGRFTSAVHTLQDAQKDFTKINNQINQLQQKLASFNTKKAPTVQLNIKSAMDNINKLIGALNRLEKKAATMGIAVGGIGAATQKAGGTSAGTPKRAAAPMGGGTSSGRPKVTPAPVARKSGGGGRGGTRYQALGQTLIDTGGVGVLDFAKGMGVAYGIAGLGTLMGNVIRDSADYNNIIQTTKNILGTHDKAPFFDARFKEMERTVRNVGIETKFTAPQVADASKFLAMAGFDLDAINKSIRPIADIALVGDNDLGQTADVVTNIMTGYGISPDRVRQAADVMTMTFTKSNTTLMEIAESYKYAASLLALNGTSFEEATAAIGILGDAGIKGSQAGTTMRTLALNIAKPTKAQKEMWKQLGISRTDAQGNIRPLIDIFSDLNSKNLSLTQFGSLFHKTATQGAASLAAHIDKWNEMVRLNFLSDGVTSKLAEEKKNTIQGLWYQLTSSFTEAGMQAFEDQESPIREIMNKVIAWLKSPEAIDKIKRLSAAIMDIGQTLMSFTKIVIGLYEKFEGLIMLWLKAQLYLKGALIPMRIISAVRNFTSYVVTLTTKVYGLAASFNALSSSSTRASMSMSIGGHSIGAWKRYASIYGTGNAIGRFAMPLLGGLGMIGGGVAGAYIGSSFGQYMGGDTGSGIGGLLGGLGGVMAGKNLPGWIMKLLGVIPGWGKIAALVIAAMGGLGYAVYSYKEKVKTAIDANEDWVASTKNLNGISLADAATQTDKYLQLVYTKQLDANGALAEYIKLREKELGLMGDLNSKEDKTPFQELEAYKEGFQNASWASKAISSKDLDIHTNWWVNEALRQTNYSAWMDYNGFRLSSSGTAKRQTINETAKRYAAAQYLFNLGSSLTEGSSAQLKRDSLVQSLLQASSLDEWNAVMSQWDNEKAQMLSSVIPGSGNWSFADIGANSLADNQKGYHYVAGFVKAIDESLQSYPTLMSWLRILESLKMNGGTGIPQELQEDFFKNSGVLIFDKDKYGGLGEFGSEAFMNFLGFSNGQWSGYSHPTGKQLSYLDPVTGRMVQRDEMSIRTGEQAKNDYLSFHQQIIDAVRKTSPKIQPYFNSFIDMDIWHPEDQSGLAKGATKELDGVTYTWNGSQWVPPTPSGLAALTNTQMNQRLKVSGNSVGDTGNGTSGNLSGGGYTNQYKSTSAVPKQIIVKIENLMNVESVDMSDPNVAATVNNLKEQMAQALIEVVADFDANASNLT